MVTANCLHPGFPLQTDLARNTTGAFGAFLRASQHAAKPASHGTRVPLYLATSPDVASITGKYVVDTKVSASSTLSNDRAAATRLGDVSAKLCGLGA